MWAIKDKKTGEFVKALCRDDGVGIPDLHMTKIANDAKVYKSRVDANNVVDRFKTVPGLNSRLEVIKVWGRTPN